MPNDIVSLGLQLQYIIIPVLSLAWFALTGALIYWGAQGVRAIRAGKRLDWDDAKGGTLAFGIVFTLAGLGALAGFFAPFDAKYYQNYEVKTTIVSVSNTFDEYKGEVTVGDFVVEIEGFDQPVSIEDSRIVKLEGEDVTLLCKVGWNYLAADSWRCEIRAF